MCRLLTGVLACVRRRPRSSGEGAILGGGNATFCLEFFDQLFIFNPSQCSICVLYNLRYL